MERLGLWGEGTASFGSFADFLEGVGGRGVGALELVAMDMKARGMFVCRTLSFQGACAAGPRASKGVFGRVGALELVAMDMKARGMSSAARSCSRVRAASGFQDSRFWVFG